MKQMYRRPLTVSPDIRTRRHCAFLLHAHLVFVTKFRPHVSGDGQLGRGGILRHVCPDFEVELVASNGKSNHVHLPVQFLPTAALAKLDNSLKECRPGGPGTSSPTWCSITGGRRSFVRHPISPGPPGARLLML
jgi:hypothetical protein